MSILAFLRARAIHGVEVVTAGSYSRTIEIGGCKGTVTVTPADGHALRAAIRFPRLSALPTIVARLRRVLDLAADPDAIGAHLEKDAALAPLVAARPGLRVPGAWDGFELAVRAVLGQQITVSAARTLASKLVTEYGEPLGGRAPSPAGLTHVFPGAARLARAKLALLGMPRMRAAALSSLAAAVVADPHVFSARRSLDETIAQLRELDGVGEWTAQYIAMREFREPDAFPAADVALLRAMGDAEGRRPTPRALLERAERWRPWRAYAAQHLWTELAGGMDYVCDSGASIRRSREIGPMRRASSSVSTSPSGPSRPATTNTGA
jgi:AraC family transcriptional regulator of adaptative response / DNA-3-methyladenine glycosylase II